MSSERGAGVTLAIVNARVWTGDRARDRGPRPSPSPASESWRSARRARSAGSHDGRADRSMQPGGLVRPRVHRRARALRRRRLPAGVGAAARREDAATSSSRASRPSRRRCPRARGSPAATGITGCGAASCRARVDRRGHAGPPGVGQPARRAHGAGEHRRARRRRRDARHAPTSPAARSCATRAASRPGVLKDNAMALVDARGAARHPTQMRTRALDAAMKYVAEQGVTSVHT